MIVFKNKGLIDVRSITTFGISSKENDSAIGYFGTGLKYAIAILLREECDIEIHIGKNVYKFGKSQEKVRVNEFTFITMNDVALSFTTELGKNWELWQAFRELYCNCKDEYGEIFKSNNAECEIDETMVLVSGSKFEDLFYGMDKFILSSNPIHSFSHCDVHEGESEFIFYKGISVYKLHKPSLFTYNLKGSVDLSEDRTLKYFNYYINQVAKDIARCKDSQFINIALRANDYYLEHDFEYEGSPSDEFVNALLEAARKFDTSVSKSAMKLCRGWAIEAFAFNSSYELDVIEKKMLEKAIEFCKFIGHDPSSYQIKFSDNLGENVLGRAHNEIIYLSKRVFMQGTKQVAVTLLEEYFHLQYDLVDETYKMQTFLFDVIGGLGERLKGEPL